MTTKKQVIVYAAAVFLAGVIAGGVIGYSLAKRRAFIPPRSEDMAVRMVERLKSKLQLTAGQIRQIEPLARETAGELQVIHANSAQRTGEIFKKYNQHLAAFLTPEQKSKLELMEKEREEFFRKTFKGKRGHRGNPSDDNRSPKE